MLKSNLQQILKNGENSGIEFKRDDLRPEQLAKEVVALANLQGGSGRFPIEQPIAPFLRQILRHPLGAHAPIVGTNPSVTLFLHGNIRRVTVQQKR
jgi:hypothetical protein